MPENSPSSPQARSWRDALPPCALAGSILLAYSGTLRVPFVFDDRESIVGNPTLGSLKSALLPPDNATVGGRPVLNLSLAVNRALGGDGVWGYHAANLLIHILAAMALLGIVRRTLEPALGRRARPLALSAALVWALHPLLTESVTYVIQRAESLMGLFYLLSVYCFIRGADASKPTAAAWRILCVGACALGMATKEVMVSAPLVILLLDRTFIAGSLAAALRSRGGVYAGLAATWILLAALVVSGHGRGGTAGFSAGVAWWSYALTQLPAVAHYLRLCLWPHPLAFDYGTSLAGLTAGGVPGAIVVLGLAAATVWALVRRPALGFLGFAFFAILAPSSSVVPVVTETMAEHRMYLPLIPVVLVAVAAVGRVARGFTLPICVVLAAALGLATFLRNGVYRSEESLWRDTVDAVPDNPRAHNNLGFVLSGEPGRLGDAVGQYEEAVRLRPSYATAHANLANALVRIPGRMDDAIAHYEESLRLDPTQYETQYNLACALQGRPGRADEAIERLEEAVRLKPDYAEAHANLGFELQGRPGGLAGAIAHYEASLRLNPSNSAVHANLALAILQSGGSRDEAAAHVRESLRLDPGNPTARGLLGRLGTSAP
jgi:cytochrome c-type biogenesis protein CcmH/NrfG